MCACARVVVPENVCVCFQQVLSCVISASLCVSPWGGGGGGGVNGAPGTDRHLILQAGQTGAQPGTQVTREREVRLQ